MPTPIEQDDPAPPPLEVETVSETAEDDASTVLVAAEIISDSSKAKPPPRKRPKKKPLACSSDNIFNSLPPQRVEAASDARVTLEETVQSLPVTLPGPVTETQVRSFGRLCINGPCDDFNSTSALYPVGFSCDRFDFSPVHGRIIKLRCSILSGRSIKESQLKGGFLVSDIPDGPIFRILWGQGVDDDEDSDYSFNPATSAAPIVTTGFPVTDTAINDVMTTTTNQILPEVGMKVRVRFENDQYFGGVITSVGEPSGGGAKTKRKRKQVDVTVRYNDGSTEAFLFPDPDLSLELPGQSR
jgi:F/Y-rich N-terminus